MKPLKLIFFLLTAFAVFSCNKDDDEITGETQTVIINELLPKNSQYGADQDGEYDDWIELYNPSATDQDISGYFLSDSKKELGKWKFPEGTVIAKNSYLIVWADGDTTQNGLHTNYKLSAEKGENVVLLNPEKELINLVEFPPTLLEKSWARKPNASGDFEWAEPTFNAPNN